MARLTRTRPQGHRIGEQGGFSLLEVLIGASMLAIALLGHTASIFSEHQLSSEQRARSTAMLAMEQFVERMRSDEDFDGLFARLSNLQEISRRSAEVADAYFRELIARHYEKEALATTALPSKDVTADPSTSDALYGQWLDGNGNLTAVNDFEATRTNYAPLTDGRRAFAPQTYYDDFVVPAGIRDFHVAVEVPSAAVEGVGPFELREDLPLPQFGLPADLNGDGAIDDAAHSRDCLTLPVIVTFRWTTGTGAAQEMRLASWIGGHR